MTRETSSSPSLLAEFGKSVLRIVAALAVILGIPALGYLFWQPGNDAPLPEFANNAIWIGHGWLGDDEWFIRNGRDPAKFRSEAKISELLRKLADHRIRTVYPHLCPARFDGRIAAYDDAQVERFLDLAEKHGIKVIPWLGGVLDGSARPDDENWRRNFIASAGELLTKHPRLAGVQINIEPLPSGDADLLRLLDEMRPVLPPHLVQWREYGNSLAAECAAYFFRRTRELVKPGRPVGGVFANIHDLGHKGHLMAERFCREARPDFYIGPSCNSEGAMGGASGFQSALLMLERFGIGYLHSCDRQLSTTALEIGPGVSSAGSGHPRQPDAPADVACLKREVSLAVVHDFSAPDTHLYFLES